MRRAWFGARRDAMGGRHLGNGWWPVQYEHVCGKVGMQCSDFWDSSTWPAGYGLYFWANSRGEYSEVVSPFFSTDPCPPFTNHHTPNHQYIFLAALLPPQTALSHATDPFHTAFPLTPSPCLEHPVLLVCWSSPARL